MVNRIAIAVGIVTIVSGAGACSYSAPDPGADAEVPSIVAFEFPTSGADEGLTASGTTITVPVVLNKPSSQRITAKCNSLVGSGATAAEEQIDFTVNTHDLVFEPGVERLDVVVDITHDLDDTETEENFSLALSDVTGGTLNADKAIHSVRIADHILPRISFDQISTTTSETTTTNLTVTLTAPSEGTSTVVVGVAGGTTPADGDDFTIVDGTVITIADGQMTGSAPIGEKNDPRDEPQVEDVVFELKGASQNLVLGTDKLATHHITDDDDQPVARFSISSDTTTEGIGKYNVTVELSEESEFPITVNYSRDTTDTTDNAEATVENTSVAFSPHTFGVTGDKSKTFSITIDNDTRDELVETVIVNLDTADNATVQAASRFTLSISEDANDRPTVQFMVADSTATEADNTKVITVTLSAPSDKTVTASFSLGGTAIEGPTSQNNADYEFNTIGVTFNPDDVSEDITVDIHDNDPPTNENPETVVLTLVTPTNATVGSPPAHTLTISE